MTIVKKKNPQMEQMAIDECTAQIGILSSKSFTIPKKGTRISYKIRGSNFYDEATILGRAGKATGKNKHWINIEGSDKSLKSFDLGQVEDLCELEENIYLTAVDTNDVDVRQAILVELENWKHLGVYSEAEDNGQVCVSTRWVVTEKNKDGEKVVKARFVARGFEETDLKDIRKDSPTCGKDTLRLCLTILASKHWKISSKDIKATRLEGKEINRDVFLILPAEADTDKLWRLNEQFIVYQMLAEPGTSV